MGSGKAGVVELPPDSRCVLLQSARQRRLLRRGDWMRQLSREQWQLIYSRLLHERHARRVTNEMLLRVQDTDTTKLGRP